MTGDLARRSVPFAVAAGALSLIVIVPAVALVAYHGFVGLYGQDAFGYADYAVELAAAVGRLEAPPPFFWPPGYPVLVAVSGLLGAGDRAGQLVSLLCGSALPVAVAFLARELLRGRYSDRSTVLMALFAGALTAISPQLWQSSVVGMSDTAAALFGTLGALASLRFHRHGRWLALLASAGAFAFAIEVRWVYGLVALPFVVLALARIWRESRESLARAVFLVAAAAVTGVLVLSPMLFGAWSSAAAGRPLPFLGEFEVHRWDPLSVLQSTFITIDGRLEYPLSTGLFYLSQPLQPYWLFVCGLLILPGLIAVARRLDARLAATLIAWPAIVIMFLMGGAYQNTRFFMTALPPLSILAALGAGWLWSRAGDRVIGRVSAHSLLVSALTTMLVLNGALALRYANGFIQRQVDDQRGILALAAEVPASSRIIALGPTAALRHYGREVTELFYLEPEAAEALLADGTPTYLLIDVRAVRTQFADQAAGRTLSLLTVDDRLHPVSTASIWTLYRISE